MKKFLCTFFAVLSFLYYLWLGIHNGFGLSVLPFWLLLAALFLFLGFWQKLPFAGRVSRALRMAVRAIFVMSLTIFVSVESFVLWGIFQNVPASCELDYLIVLGAGVNGQRPSHTLELRLERALAYLEEHPDTRVVVSGGQGSSERISEAESMYLWLEESGVDPSRILLEGQSTTTAENMQYSFPLIQADSSSPELSVGIVTSNFHIFRSLRLAARAGQMQTKGQTVYHLYGLSAEFSCAALPHYMVREFFTICVDTALGNMTFF